MALDRNRLMNLQNQQADAMKKAKEESKRGWLPPVSDVPYQCELIGIAANFVEKLECDVVNLTFKIVGAATDAKGNSLVGKKFQIGIFMKPNLEWLWVNTCNRIFDGAAYPDEWGKAAIMIEDTRVNKGFCYEVKVTESEDGQFINAHVGKLLGQTKK